MRRLHIGAALAALAVVFAAPWTLRATDQAGRGSGPMIQSLSEPGEGLAITQVSPESGRATFAATRGQGVRLPAAETEPAASRAALFVDLYGAAFGLGDRTQVMVAGPPKRDELGVEHVKFQQLHEGVPVTGGQFLVHLKGSRVMAANGRVLERLPDDVRPEVAPASAQAAARSVVAKYKPAALAGVRLSEPRLEVFNRGFLEHKTGSPSRLAWFIEATNVSLREYIWVDAKTGAVLLHFSQRHEAKNRQVYNANGMGGLPGTLARSEGQPPTGNVDVDDAYTLSGVTYDYFFMQHGRDSYDGAGATIVSSVNWNDGVSCPNAFWNSVQMVYCLGFASADDVVGHEITHAVTEREANLFYFVQSGALNESYSDSFGEAIDLLNVTPTDTPGVRWEVGEDLPIGAIRNMMDPTLYFNPGKMSDVLFFWCDTTSDGGGVHTNSGVPNHAFALMVDGGTYNGHSVTGVGLVKAGQIQYRALTVYLTNSSGFLDNFNALMQACSDLIGTSGITAADCAQVYYALLAVEMNAQWGCPDFQSMSMPSICPTGGTTSYLFNDGFDTMSPPWGVSSTTATQWGLQTFHVYEGGVASYGPNPGSISDHRIAMTSSVMLPAGARAMFVHTPDFEPVFDGGVVEYSNDGGMTWQDGIPLIDGGLMPDSTIPVGFGNPLANRLAFSMASYGYKPTRLNLAMLAGQSVRLRFRIGTDNIVSATGWMVDNVAIYSCTPTAGAPTITAQPAPQFVTIGTTANFSVTAAGNPTLRYQWTKNGTAIPGATSAMLSLPNVQWLDYGYYGVIVSNDLGTAVSDGALLVAFPAGSEPAITKQPRDQTVTVGQTARFAVDAFGAPTKTFQWQVSIDNGGMWTNVVDGVYSGATTPTLTITGTTLAQNTYLFRVIVANMSGSSTSKAARLNVLPANLITNGTFGAGTTGWLLFETPPGNMESLVSGGEFWFNRAGGSATQATIFQNTGLAVTGTPIEATFDLGNSANIRKRISVLLIDADFSDITVCTFWLEAAAPMRTYRMRTHTTKSWANASVYFYAASTGTFATNGGYYRLDNVSLNFNPNGSNVRTDCVDPTSPLPPGGAESASLLTNGDFSAGLAPWTTFGTITGQVTNGVFQFIRNAGLPAGVVLQATGAAVALNEFLTATFDLGNSSPIRKRVTVLIHANDFSDLAACTFWLPPGLPLSTYQMKMRATKAWAAGAGTGAALSIYGATVGTDQWIRLDNASLTRTPGSAIQGTECLEPIEVVTPPFFREGAGRSGGQARAPAAAQSPARPPGASFARVNFDAAPGEWMTMVDALGARVLRWQRPIDLTGVADARLVFASSVAGPPGAAEVQVSLDGITWHALARVPPDEAWTEVDVDLSEYAGHAILVQFVYATAGGEPAIWRVRNVRVTRRE